MTRPGYFIVLCCCLFVFACKKNARQRLPVHLYVDYYVRYLAPAKQIRAEAQFAEGVEPQSARSKTIPEGVEFMGEQMEMQSLKKDQYRYIYTDTSAFPSGIYFQYFKGDDRRREELAMLPVVRYEVEGPAQKTSGLTLITNEDLLKGNESLVILVADKHNRAASFTISGPISDTIHQIPPETFQGLQAGPGSLYLVKRMKKTMEQANQTVTATLEYYTDTLSVRIED